MKTFDLREQNIKLLMNHTIIELLCSIEYNRGLPIDLPKKIKLNRLHDFSKRRSVTSSNEIEGVKVKKCVENNLFTEKYDPETNEEKLLIGYNNALTYIFNAYKYQELDIVFIKELHRIEWEILNPSYGGKFKDHQNFIREYSKDGSFRTVFIPCKPYETEQLLENLIYQYNSLIIDPTINRLCLIFTFILDFLCIHPFNDGNGRVSRLLTTYLLFKSGYDLDKYYSISYLILKSLNNYYESLEKSSNNWYENENDYTYFVIYQLRVLHDGYRKLRYIININSEKGTLNYKIQKIINESTIPLSKGDIEEILFSNTRDSIEEVLASLVKNNKIKLLQKGKYSLYYR